MTLLAILLATALAAEPAAPVGDRGPMSVPAMPDSVAPSPTAARGQPRVSKTRCAMVTCEAAACAVAEARQAVVATPQPAPCPVRRAES